MSTIKINWGAKIALLYGGFVALIISLVVGSYKQNADLVTSDYYQQELAYQDVIDASKNQSTLSTPINIYANASVVTIEFPEEFSSQKVNGEVHFYSPVNENWDKKLQLKDAIGSVTIPRSELKNTRYKVKVAWNANGVNYFQESEISLHQ